MAVQEHSNGRDGDAAVPSAVKRRLLFLLFLFLTLAGVTLIVASQSIDTKTVSAVVLGIGIGLLPTGFVSLLQSYFTDAIYRQDMAHDIRQRVKEAFEEVDPLLSDGAHLGVERVYRTRADALQEFAARVEAEINRASRGKPARLWFVCTSMRGFLHYEGPGFRPKELLERAAAMQRELDLRFLMTHPDWARVRELQEHRVGRILAEIDESVEVLRSSYKVEPARIRFFAGGATMFAIATSESMLLNPYPYEEEAHRCFTIVVRRTGEGADDIYRQYLENHFEKAWKTAGEASGGQVRISEDQDAGNALLSRVIAEQHPRTADLLEYSTDTVKPLIARLCEQGAHLRILVKHPEEGVGEAQRDRIYNNLRYLRRFVLRGPTNQVDIRCYRTWPSLRGRRIGDALINVGWYTPDLNEHGEPTEMEVAGDIHPLVTADLHTPEGHYLERMFDAIFSPLWVAGEQHDAMEILERHEARRRNGPERVR